MLLHVQPYRYLQNVSTMLLHELGYFVGLLAG
jgi:hypothetical protein